MSNVIQLQIKPKPNREEPAKAYQRLLNSNQVKMDETMSNVFKQAITRIEQEKAAKPSTVIKLGA